MSTNKVVATRAEAGSQALRRALLISGATVALAAGAQTAAAVELYNKDGDKFEFTAEIGAGGFHVTEDFTGQNRDTVSWAEGYAIMGFKGEFALDATEQWKVFGAITGIVNGDRGQGDAIGYTNGTEDGGQVQDAYGGVAWTSGTEGGASAKLSGGRQKWVLGDGFLIAGDQPTSGENFGAQYDEGGAYYMNPRRVFANTAILNVETGTPIRFDAFYLDSEKAYNGKRSIAGVNVDYVDAKFGTLGATYIRGLEVDRPDFNILPSIAASDGMNLYSVHGNTSLGVKDLSLAFTYVNEQNESRTPLVQTTFGLPNLTGDYTLDAWAWYGSISYTFSRMPWTPTLMYRYASFSDDDPATGTTYEGYDPLFYGVITYDTWFIGEIAANYTGPFNSNADVQTIGLKTAPNIDLGIGKLTGLSGYINHYQLREPGTFSIAPATDGDIGTELAMFAEMQLFENLYVSPLYSVLFPGDGYKSVYGNDDNVHNFQFVTILTY